MTSELMAYYRLMYDGPQTVSQGGAQAAIDWPANRKTIKNSNLKAEERISAARTVSDYCSHLGPDSSDDVQQRSDTILHAVFFRADVGGMGVKLVRGAGFDKEEDAATMLKLAYDCAAGITDLQDAMLKEIRSLLNEPSADSFAAKTSQIFEGMLSLSGVKIEKTSPPKKSEPALPEQKSAAETKSIPEQKSPGVTEGGPSELPIKVVPKKSKSKAKTNAATPVQSEKITAPKGDEKTEETKKSEKTGENRQTEKISEAKPPETNKSIPTPSEATTSEAKPPEAKPAENPAETIQPAELKSFDILGAQEILKPAVKSGEIQSDEQFGARLSAAKDLASLILLSADANTGLNYAKLIIDGATSLDPGSGSVVISVLSKDRRVTSERILDMYWLAFECVRKFPEQAAELMKYMSEQYESASHADILTNKDADKKLQAQGQASLKLMRSSLQTFCFSLLKPSAGAAQTAQPISDPKVVGSILQTLMITTGLGSLEAGQDGLNKKTREQGLAILQSMLNSDAPQNCILAARALRIWNYDSIEQKQSSLGAIIQTLKSKPSWPLPQQRAMLEEAILLDLNAEIINDPAKRVFSVADPLGAVAWLKTRPELMICALMASAGVYPPLYSFESQARSSDPKYKLKPDAASSGLWMDLLAGHIRSVLTSGDDKAITGMSNDRSPSEGYEKPYANVSLTSLFLKLLDYIIDNSANNANFNLRAVRLRKELKNMLE